MIVPLVYIKVGPDFGAPAVPGLKRLNPTKKNSEKHWENPPEMHASQRRYISNDSGLYLHVSIRITPSNGP